MEIQINNYRDRRTGDGRKSRSSLKQLIKRYNAGADLSEEIVPQHNVPSAGVDYRNEDLIPTKTPSVDTIRYPSEVSIRLHAAYTLPDTNQMAFLVEFENGINPFSTVPFNIARFLPKNGRKTKHSPDKNPKETYLELVAITAKEILSGKGIDTKLYNYDEIKAEITENPNKAIFLYSPNN